MRFRRGLAFNTALNAATAPLLAIGQLLLVMVLADGMSVEMFGTWSFLLGFTFFQGYAGILDLGFSTSALRAIVREDVDGDEVRAGPSAFAFRSVYKRAALVGSFIIVFALPIVLSIVGADFDRSEYIVVVLSFACLIPIDMLHSSNLICLEARRRYPTIRLIQLLSLYSWIGIAWVALRAGASISVIAVVFVVQSVVVAIASSFAARSFLTRSRVRAGFDSPEVRDMFRVGKWMILFQIVTIIQAQMDRTVIAIALGVVEVARYQIPYKVFAFGFLVLQQLPSAVSPVASSIQAEGDIEKSGRLFEMGTRWTYFASVPVFIAIFVFARPLIVLWVGDDYANTYWIARLFMVYLCVLAFHQLGMSMLAAHGRSRSLFLLYIVAVTVNLIVSIALVGPLGIAGVVVGTIVGLVVAFVPYVIVERAEFQLRASQWITSILVPALLVLMWTIAGAFVVGRVFESATSFVAVSVGVALVAAWGWLGVFLMPRARSESRQILSSLRH